jgi:hypothetical protein
MYSESRLVATQLKNDGIEFYVVAGPHLIELPAPILNKIIEMYWESFK